jgi:hypothetical protein
MLTIHNIQEYSHPKTGYKIGSFVLSDSGIEEPPYPNAAKDETYVLTWNYRDDYRRFKCYIDRKPYGELYMLRFYDREKTVSRITNNGLLYETTIGLDLLRDKTQFYEWVVETFVWKM